jgi:hypothetical protein
VAGIELEVYKVAVVANINEVKVTEIAVIVEVAQEKVIDLAKVELTEVAQGKVIK